MAKISALSVCMSAYQVADYLTSDVYNIICRLISMLKISDAEDKFIEDKATDFIFLQDCDQIRIYGLHKLGGILCGIFDDRGNCNYIIKLDHNGININGQKWPRHDPEVVEIFRTIAAGYICAECGKKEAQNNVHRCDNMYRRLYYFADMCMWVIYFSICALILAGIIINWASKILQERVNVGPFGFTVIADDSFRYSCGKYCTTNSGHNYIFYPRFYERIRPHNI